MPVTVTATYDSADKVRNAEDDLRGTGIPREKIFVDKDAHRIKVLSPDDSKPEIVELLRRHEPTEIS